MGKRKAAVIIGGVCLLTGICLFPSYGAGKNPNFYQDESGWHYLITIGALAKNKTVEIDGSWYYFDGDGIMRTGWIQYNGSWYYFEPGGPMATGWKEVAGKQYYLNPQNGSCMMNTVTPDGYFVDGNGVRKDFGVSVLGTTVSKRTDFCRSDWFQMTNWSPMMPTLDSVGNSIRSAFKDKRKFHVYSNKVGYGETDGSYPVELYKTEENGGYNIRLRVNLDSSSVSTSNEATYNYQVFRMFCYLISSTPENLISAIQSSWSGSNSNGINALTWVGVGDCEVRFEAGDKFGNFFIRPVPR